MLPRRLARQTITVLSPTMTTNYGKPVADWSKPIIVGTTEGCSVQPRDTTMQSDGRLATSSTMRVWCPISAPITAKNRIRWAGSDWAIEGDVLPFPDPLGNLSHAYFDMVRSTG